MESHKEVAEFRRCVVRIVRPLGTPKDEVDRRVGAYGPVHRVASHRQCLALQGVEPERSVQRLHSRSNK